MSLNPFAKTSVASITEGFSKTASELEALIDRLDTEMADHNKAITDLEDKVAAAFDEQVKAKAILCNINNLISKE